MWSEKRSTVHIKHILYKYTRQTDRCSHAWRTILKNKKIKNSIWRLVYYHRAEWIRDCVQNDELYNPDRYIKLYNTNRMKLGKQSLYLSFSYRLQPGEDPMSATIVCVCVFTPHHAARTGFNDCLQAAMTCVPHIHSCQCGNCLFTVCSHASTTLKGSQDLCASCWDACHSEMGEGWRPYVRIHFDAIWGRCTRTECVFIQQNTLCTFKGIVVHPKMKILLSKLFLTKVHHVQGLWSSKKDQKYYKRTIKIVSCAIFWDFKTVFIEYWLKFWCAFTQIYLGIKNIIMNEWSLTASQ